MNRIALVASAVVLILIASFGYLVRIVKAGNSDERSSATETQTIVAATTAFLKSLSTDQRKQVQFPFAPQKTARMAKFARTGGPNGLGGPGGAMHSGPPPGQRPGMGPAGGFIGEKYGQAVWSNYPVSDVLRPGLRLGNLTAEQRDAVMYLLKAALSPKGYQKLLDIMGSDQVLHESGTPFCSGTDCYTIGIFGEPSTTRPWMLEFGGHHLGLNITIVGEQGVMTPTLTGAQPAVYTSNGKTVRALSAENDRAFALLDGLSENQRSQAILNYRIDDLVLGPGRAGMTIQPEGLKASALNTRQRALLLDVISEWAGIVNEAYAKARMTEIEAGLDDTWFAWSGPTTHEPGRNGSAYYRIQGPRLVIEFSPQGVGGDSTMHVHTMYRDPTNDYGIKLTGAR
jgi:hypothetical protein